MGMLLIASQYHERCFEVRLPVTICEYVVSGKVVFTRTDKGSGFCLEVTRPSSTDAFCDVILK